jgi:hypothetical protein
MRSKGRAPLTLVTSGVEGNVGTHVSDCMVSVAHKRSLIVGCSGELATDCLARGKCAWAQFASCHLCAACHTFLFRL